MKATPLLAVLALCLSACDTRQPDADADPPVAPEDVAQVGAPSVRPDDDAVRKKYEEHFRRNAELDTKLGQRITVEGGALGHRMGAMVQLDGKAIYLLGLYQWPAEALGKKVRVTGRLIRKSDLPVYVWGTIHDTKSGIHVPPGVDLVQARRRHLLAEFDWKVID